MISDNAPETIRTRDILKKHASRFESNNELARALHP